MGAFVVLAEVVLSLCLQVDLRLEPGQQTALVGETIDVDLMAHSGLPQSITAIDAIVSWDPARLQLLSATLGDFPPFVSGFLPDPDGINDDTTDGQALFTALAPIAAPATVPPDLFVARFSFLVLTSACVELTPAVGAFGHTRVIGTTPGVEITGTIAPAVSLEVPGTWVPLGGGIAATGGLVPQLEGDGILLECEPWTLTLTDGTPSTSSYLVIGDIALNLPLKGGVLVPDLDIIVALPSGPTGDLILTGAWPAGFPAGIEVYSQFWFVDPGAANGFAASNGLLATTP